MTVEKIVNYCEPIGIARSAAIKHCGEFLEYRLIEPYDPTDLEVYMRQRVKVTHAGRIHYEFALVHRQPDNGRLERHAMWPFPGIASVIATGRRGFW